MVRATWRVLAFGALMAAVALPASAQVVIGGSGSPNVEVNWAVLESLGRQPTLADMLKGEAPTSQARAALNQPAPKAVQFRPYKAGADTVRPVKKTAAAKPKPPAVTPVSAKSEVPVASPVVAQLVQAAQKPAPVAELPKVAQPALPPKPVIAPVPEPVKAAAPVGPQISLPEVPKPVPAAPVQIAKVEPPAAPVVNKPEPVAVAQPMALTPPAPPVPVVKAEPAPVPQQIASLPPAAPAAPVSSKGGDSLTVAFAADSARLPETVHAELDRLVKRLQKDDGLGLQLLAYAEGDDASASKARRMSLSRALEVRKYLMEQGVRSTRIEVRALGNKLEGAGPADRVDALVVNR
ncbi:MAG: OmpA family protein [Rhodospirillaceae bacterium]|nr:OmpA family protein [Rhodospirillales bacterium]